MGYVVAYNHFTGKTAVFDNEEAKQRITFSG